MLLCLLYRAPALRFKQVLAFAGFVQILMRKPWPIMLPVVVYNARYSYPDRCDLHDLFADKITGQVFDVQTG